MKTLALTLLIAVTFAAHAVPAKNCPQTLDIKIQRMGLLSEEQVFSHAQFSFSGEERADFAAHVTEIRADQTALQQNIPQSFDLALDEKHNGTCVYLGGPEHTMAKIYTKDGKNLLALSLESSTVYFTVNSLTPLTLGRQDKRPLNNEYGEIGDEGRSGDFFRAVLGFADFAVH